VNVVTTAIQDKKDYQVKDEDNRVLANLLLRPVKTCGEGQRRKQGSDQAVQVSFQADSAAQATVMSEANFRRYFGKTAKLEKTNKKLRGFNNACSIPVGRRRVEAVFAGRKADFDIYVMKAPMVSLLGLKEMGQLGITIDTSTRTVAVVEERQRAEMSKSRILTEEGNPTLLLSAELCSKERPGLHPGAELISARPELLSGNGISK
jgi:hypothetical protein